MDKANQKCFLMGCPFVLFQLNGAPSPSLSRLQAAKQDEHKSRQAGRQADLPSDTYNESSSIQDGMSLTVYLKYFDLAFLFKKDPR